MPHTIGSCLRSLEELADITKYDPLKESEFLLMMDIQGSTTRIASGGFEDVNICTTVCIAALRDSCEANEIRLQHGGDRVIAVANISAYFIVCETIENLKRWMQAQYDLTIVSRTWQASELKNYGHSFYYAAYARADGMPQWQFHCDTMAKLEAEMKTEGNRLFPHGKHEMPPISGFRCDFQPLRVPDSSFACCIVEFTDRHLSSRMQTMRKVLSVIKCHSTYGINAPFLLENLNWQTDILQLKALEETGSHYRQRRRFNFLYRLMNRYRLHQKDRFRKWFFQRISMLPYSIDHIKYDGNLKMVICVANAKKEAMTNELRELELAGEISFGLHWSDEAVITCSVNSAKGNVHFIDGMNGGLTTAFSKLRKSMVQNTSDSLTVAS